MPILLEGMEETLLPDSIRAKASLAGREYAWRRDDIAAVLQAAVDVGLAPFGGQVQFRFPDGTCELYWLEYLAPPRMCNEPWAAYSERSACEIERQIVHLYTSTDISQEARQWTFIRQKIDAGINPHDHLWFVLYFVTEHTYKD